MRKTLLVFVGLSTAGYLAGNGVGLAYDNDWLPQAVMKLIEKYFELDQRLTRVEDRLKKLEERVSLKSSQEDSLPVKEKLSATKDVKVRYCQSFKCGVIYVLRKGDVVYKLAQKERWIKIQTQEGVTGWVYGKYLQEYSF